MLHLVVQLTVHYKAEFYFSSTAGSEQAACSSNDSKPKRPHSGDRDSRGRGRGRGRGRVSSNVIQTHSMFEQGLTESLPKPSGGN